MSKVYAQFTKQMYKEKKATSFSEVSVLWKALSEEERNLLKAKVSETLEVPKPIKVPKVAKPKKSRAGQKTGYSVFFTEQSPKYPDLKGAPAKAAVIGPAWQQLSEEQKQHYKELAKQAESK